MVKYWMVVSVKVLSQNQNCGSIWISGRLATNHQICAHLFDSSSGVAFHQALCSPTTNMQCGCIVYNNIGKFGDMLQQ